MNPREDELHRVCVFSFFVCLRIFLLVQLYFVFNPEYPHLFHQKTKYLFFTFELNPRAQAEFHNGIESPPFPFPLLPQPRRPFPSFPSNIFILSCNHQGGCFFLSSTSSRHVISQSSSSLLSPPMPMNVFSFFFFLKKQKTTPATNTTTTTPPTMKPIWVRVKPK